MLAWKGIKKEERIMGIAEQVRVLRKKARMTQRELAARAGVGLRFIRELEQGKVTVRIDKVNEVLTLFGYHLEAVKDHVEAAQREGEV